ncbi:MAG TPA: hypothetical protein VFB73_11295 [Chloroflexota bacterium]|nr:hypothetical protein [Chloroflexota bacterium]
MTERRYEREIDELLKRLEAEQPRPSGRKKQAWAERWAAAWRSLRSLVALSPVERLMVLTVALLLLTLLFGLFAPRVAGFLGVLAIACFAMALGLSVARGIAHGEARGDLFDRARGPALDWGTMVWRVRRWLRRWLG